MDNIKFITGIIFLIVGICLLIASFFLWPLIFYAIALIVIGILLMLDIGNESKIEKIKSRRRH